MSFPIENPHGDPYLDLLARAHPSQQAATTRILTAHDGPDAIRRLMDNALSRGRRYSATALAGNPPRLPLACDKGCYHCCWATVGVTAPEVLYLADRLRDRLPPSQLEVITAGAARRAEKLNDLDRGELLEARVPCALLKDGSCSAYEVRPLVCRWACSPNLHSCLDLLVHRRSKGLEMEDVRYQPMQEVWRGMRAGLGEVQLDGTLLVLNSALAVALAEPDATARYLRGEAVLAATRLER